MESLTKEQVKKFLFQVVAEELEVNISDLSEKTSLQDDLEADSLEIVCIAVELEEKFKINFENEILLKFRNIGDIIEAITQMVSSVNEPNSTSPNMA